MATALKVLKKNELNSEWFIGEYTMKYLIIIFVLIIAGCSKDNLELSKKTSQINNDKDLIFI